MDPYDYADGDKEFAAWLLEVNAYVLEATTMSIFDAVDQPWRDWYDNGVDAHEIGPELAAHPQEIFF